MPIQLSEINRTKNKSKSAVELRGIHSPRGLERKMERFNRFMVKTMRKRFENMVLKKLNKTTQEKFQDAKNEQIGNYAVVYNKLYNEYKRSINKQFNNEKISQFVKNLYRQTHATNSDQFAGTVNTNLGVNLDDVLKTDGLNSFVNAKSLESTDMLTKLRNETATMYKANALRRMSAGASLKDLFEQVKKDTGMRLKRGDLIARNELKQFNAELTKKRQQNLDITKAIWQTVEDERVRPCHNRFNGQEYVIGKGLFCSQSGEWEEPGDPINCRCVSISIINFDED